MNDDDIQNTAIESGNIVDKAALRRVLSALACMAAAVPDTITLEPKHTVDDPFRYGRFSSPYRRGDPRPPAPPTTPERDAWNAAVAERKALKGKK